MGWRGDQLKADRAARDEARRIFDSRLAQVRQDLDAKGIGGRIAAKLGKDARGLMGEAIDVAGESKGIIAGTIAGLALWFFRGPIIAWLAGMLGHDEPGQNENAEYENNEGETGSD